MLEAITIIRGLFADGPFSLSGRFYTMTEMEGGPKPVQRPHPPFLVGGTRGTGVPIDARDVLESPFSLIGSVPELVDKLWRLRLRQRWGINSFLVGWFDEPGLRDFAPVVEQLAGT